MKQYKITTENLPKDSVDDCMLLPKDPIHELKIASELGGLGSKSKLAEYRELLRQPVISSNKGTIQKEQGIKPGTELWFKLWFGKDNK